MENSVLEYKASKDLVLWILFEKITKDGDSFRCFGNAHKYKYKPPSRTAVGFQVHNKMFGASVKDGRTLEGMKGLCGRTDGTAVAAYCSATVAWLRFSLKVAVCPSVYRELPDIRNSIALGRLPDLARLYF